MVSNETKQVSDMNVLYDAFKAAMKSSAWKEEPQRFEVNFLSEIRRLQKDILSREYKTSPTKDFILNERGKIRHVHGGRMRDRVVRHALCDDILNPALEPFIIRYNCASQDGKGVDFARQAFERDLHNYWLEERTNEGWVAFIDFSKYYDNIQHDHVKEIVCPLIDEESSWLFCEIVDNFSIDVSYMTDEEFSESMDRKFNSVEYYNTITDEEKTGEKFLAKSVDIGDQVSQQIGIIYPTKIDTYVTAVRGFRRYGRYNDDMYLIHKDKDYLEETVLELSERTRKIGLFINEKKTRIVKLSSNFSFLQMKYRLSDTGRVIRRINPKSVTRERQRLKKQKNLINRGDMKYEDVEQSYKSWMGRYTKYMSKKQIENMKNLYQSLFGRNPRWKTESIPSRCPTAQSSKIST